MPECFPYGSQHPNTSTIVPLRYNGRKSICKLKRTTNCKLTKVLLRKQTALNLLPRLFRYGLQTQMSCHRLKFKTFRKVYFSEKYRSKEFKCYHASFFFSTWWRPCSAAIFFTKVFVKSPRGKMVFLRASCETWLRKKVWSLKRSAPWRSFTAAKTRTHKASQHNPL